MMSTDFKKYVTNSLPEFLLLASLEPRDVFADGVGDVLQTVFVCYDAQDFYKKYSCVFTRNGPATEPVGLDEFVAYCDSKICARFPVVDPVRYRCCMNVSDLMRMDVWARLYDRVGPRVTKYLLFNCLLFVPIQRDVYYCVHTPSQQAGRYEVLRSFWSRAGYRWTAAAKNKKNRDRNGGGCSKKTKPVTCFNIAGLLKDRAVKTIIRPYAHGEMLRDILGTDVADDAVDDDVGLDVLKSKLKVMADKDSASQTCRGIYEKAIGNLTTAAAAEIPLRRIKEFAASVVRKVVPRELFGVNGNRDQYCENLCAILNCGVLHDFTVQQIVHKIKVKKIRWLDRVDDDRRRTRVITKTLVWLTNVFVFDRIAHYFRIVTTNTPNNGVAYFTKAKWAAMCREKISPLMDGGEFFKELCGQLAADNGDSTAAKSPYRNWKLCPYAKPNGVRLIFKLRRKEDGADKRLTDYCLTFLRCLSLTYPAEFRSVSRPQFFRGWNATSHEFRNSDRSSPVYYVRTDFRDAFTSFEQGKLQAVVRDRIEHCFGKESQTVYVHSVDVIKVGGGGVVRCKKHRYFDGLPMPEFPAGSLVFYGETVAMPLSRIWEVLRRRVRCNAVELGGRRWAMTRGIVQGDRMSVALCDLLLADLQAVRLNDAVGGRSAGRLYRFVDDYVFVSSDQSAARRFLDVMRAGFRDYGLQLNQSKTMTNLDSDGGDGLVRFLGFRLNTATGEVTKDETAYRNRRPLHFFDCDLGRGRPGRALYAKMTRPNRYPVPAVLMSRSFNSTATVAQNVASVVAYKAHAAVAAIKQYFFHLNPTFLLRTVDAVARLMYAKTCGLTQRHSAVTPMQCKWIVYEVYARVLRRRFPARDGHHAACAVVDRIRDRQFAIGRKCNVRELKTALRRTGYDFTKMFG